MGQYSNKEDFLRKYAEQDTRLQDEGVFGELLANNNGINIERLFNMGKGTREIHSIKFFNEIIPMRVISLREERVVNHSASIHMKDETYLSPGTIPYNMQFERFRLRKLLSLATSSCPESPDSCYLTMDDIDDLSDTTFISLVNRYSEINAMYNAGIEVLTEDHIDGLLEELRDPEKKFQSLFSMNMNELRTIMNIYLNNETLLEDNIHLSKQLTE